MKYVLCAFSLFLVFCLLTPDIFARPPKESKEENTEKSTQGSYFQPTAHVKDKDSIRIFQDGILFNGTLETLDPDSILTVDITFDSEKIEGEKEVRLRPVFHVTTVADTAGKPQWRYHPLPDNETFRVVLLDGQEIAESRLRSFPPEMIRFMQYFPEDSLLFVVSRIRDGARVTAYDEEDDAYHHYYIRGSGGGLSGKESQDGWFLKGLDALNSRPQFRGEDMKKFQQWFAENLVYPHDVRLAGMEGEIILSFTIDRYGTLTNLEFIDGQASESMIREVARVFSITPVWQPGYYWGRPYQIQYYMPVIFKINP